MLSSCTPPGAVPSSEAAPPEQFRSLHIATKRKRRPAGTPDPDAEVVSLSPRTLLESDRYVCEICNQGFQRDQNLQMHRRRHKVPWKLLKREAGEAARKRVFVCPEPTCLHHDPSHALGDLVGIKKHFRRKHSGHRQWACARCSKAYAVHSDYKAHLKTCGTRGHSCDCGRVFSRVESFIEHQDTCNARRPEADMSPARGGGSGCAVGAMAASRPQVQAASLSRTASSTSPSSDLVVSPGGWPGQAMPSGAAAAAAFRRLDPAPSPRSEHRGTHNLELQLMPPCGSSAGRGSAPAAMAYYSAPHCSPVSQDADAMLLQLSIGVHGDRVDTEPGGAMSAAARMKEEAREQLRVAMADKAMADDARAQSKRQAELAEQELASAKRMRHQAQVELSRAHALRDHAVRQVNATLLQITCYSCRQRLRAMPPAAMSSDVACSYVSSVVTEGGDVEVDNDETLNIDGTRRPRHAKMDLI